MPRFRRDLDAIAPYRPGLRPEEIAAQHGVDEVVKLSSNECPYAPFPEVADAMASSLAAVNRYPDNDATALRIALGELVGTSSDRVMLGAGSNSLLFYTALAVGGSGTNAVYAAPSFAMYRISTIVSGSEPVEVPLDGVLRHDLGAMRSAITDSTTIVYVCNPNNPTGTHVPGDALFAFVDSIPEEVLVVVDEAYAEFATAADFTSALPLAAVRSNVVVYRTFSKVYGLAGLRLGYAVGHPEVLDHLKRVALPFAANSVALAAGLAALSVPERLRTRVAANAAGRARLHEALDARGISRSASEANFVYMAAPPRLFDALQRLGVIVRRYGAGHLRVTVGTDDENRLFVERLDEARRAAG